MLIGILRRGRLTGFAGLVLAIAGAALTRAPARADEPPKPDKSGYTIFNPTPPDLLRDFATDRPTRANIPYTIDAGQYQVESDLGFFTHDSFTKSRTTTNTWNVLTPIFKAGLTNNIQADVVFSGLYNHSEVGSHAGGAPQTFEGFGDVSLRAKVNLWGNDGGTTAFALMPYVKLPTNTGRVGNDIVEGGAFMPLAISLPASVTMIVMPQVDAQKNVADNGTHAHFSQVVNLNRPIAENLTGYVEFYADESAHGGVGTFYTLDFGLAWVLAPDLQLDVGTYVGLNKPAPDLQAYFGIARRF
jgi:hypothetical protein